MRNKHRNPRPEIFTFPAVIKAVGDEDNMVEGFANVFEVEGEPFVDDGMDIVERGAFIKTIERRVDKGLVPFVDSHVWDTKGVLGSVVSAEERKGTVAGKEVFGLFFKALFSSTSSAQEVRIKMIEGHLKMISVGMRVLNEGIKHVTSKGIDLVIRLIKEAMLLEISAVALAENDMSQVISIKGITRIPYQDLVAMDLGEFNLKSARAKILDRWSGDTAKLRQAFILHDRIDDEFRYQVGEINPDTDELAVSKSALLRATVLSELNGEDIRADLKPYFEKFGLTPPWDSPEGVTVNVSDDGMSVAGADHASSGDDDKKIARVSSLGILKSREMDLQFQLHGGLKACR